MKTAFIKLRSRTAWIAGAIFLVLALFFVTNSLVNEYRQDDCSFGLVTNEQYKQYKRSIDARLKEADFRNMPNFESKLGTALKEFLREDYSVYQKIAVAHAIMRAAGAEYRNTNGNISGEQRGEAFPSQSSDVLFVYYNYYKSRTNLVEILQSLGQGYWIIVMLSGPAAERPTVPIARTQRGTIQLKVNQPSLILDGWIAPVSKGYCPQVPSPQNVADFTP